mgnify:FL=1
MNFLQEAIRSSYDSPLRTSQLQPMKAGAKIFNLLTKAISALTPVTSLKSNLPPKRPLEGHRSKVQAFHWGGPKNVTELISCDDMGTIVHWDAAKGSKLTLFDLQVTCHSIAMEPEAGTCAAVGTANGRFHMLELNNIGQITKGVNTKPHVAIPAHTGPIFAINFLGNEYIVTGGGDKSIAVWSIHSLKTCVSRHVKHEGEVYALSVFREDENIFLSSSTDGTCKLWDIRLKQPVQATFEGHTAAVNSVAFMPGKVTTFASGADDGTVRLWDIRMDSEVAIFGDPRAPGEGINSVEFSESGRVIIAGTDYNCVKYWDVLTNGSPLKDLDYGFKCPIVNAQLSADGYTLAVLGKDGVLGIAY